MKEPTNTPQRIKYIKALLRKPYHLFYYTPQGRCILRVEDATGDFLFWEGRCISAAVDSGLEYVRHEVEMGAIEKPEEKKVVTNKKDKEDAKEKTDTSKKEDAKKDTTPAKPARG